MTIPTAIISGLALAFVPFEGRSIDTMLIHFFKALFAPNQYLFHKTGRVLALAVPVSTHTRVVPQTATLQSTQEQLRFKKLQQMISSSTTSLQNSKYDEKELHYAQLLGGAGQMPSAPVIPQPKPAVASLPSISQPAKPVQVAVPPAAPTPPVAPPRPRLVTVPVTTVPVQPAQSVQEQPAPEKLNEPSVQESDVVKKQLEDLARQKKELEQQLKALQQQMQKPATPAQTTVAPTPDPALQSAAAQPASKTSQPMPAPSAKPSITNIPSDKVKSMGITHVFEAPNLIAGIIKDSRGNVLPNILVEIKDQNGDPVRAFKSNALGQFASATPLPNGTYTIEFEDAKKQHSFDTVEVTANGNIISPLEVTSHDAREALRRELFAN